jgi:hypothetical protein
MPAPIDEIIKRRVVQLWLNGEARDKVASDLKIGAGTVSSIVSDFKKNLQGSDIDSIRELAIDAKRQGLSLSDLASHFRLYNYFKESGVAEEKIETFIANLSSSELPPERAIELVNELFNISNAESILLDQVSGYIKEKLEQKKKIDDDTQQADAVLQSKNVSIEAINEHIQLNEELKRYRLSTKDVHRLVNLLLAAKEYRYSPGKIIGKLRNIKRLENKENKLKNSCDMLSKKEAKYKDIIPLADLIQNMHIGRSELISFKIVINEAAETYGLTPSAAALHVINVIKDYNKRGQLKHELSELNFQKYAISQFCSRRSQVITSLVKLQSHGITEDQIIHVNKFLENNGYNVDMKSTASFK